MMRIARRGRFVISMFALLVVASVVLLLTWSDTEPVPSEAQSEPGSFNAAYDATEAAGDAAVALTVSARMPPSLDDGVPRRRFTGDGALDRDSGLAQVTFDWSEVPNGAGWFGHADGIDVIYEGSSFLLSFDVLGDALEGPAEVVRYELGDFESARALQFGLGQLREVALSDPELLLSFLQGVTDSRSLGEDMMDGTTLVHHEVTVDLATAAAGTSPERAASLVALRDRLGGDDVTIDVWFDDDGVVRRLLWEARYPAGTALGNVAVSITLELSDLGTDQTVEVPDEERVLEYDEYIEA